MAGVPMCVHGLQGRLEIGASELADLQVADQVHHIGLGRLAWTSDRSWDPTPGISASFHWGMGARYSGTRATLVRNLATGARLLG